MTCRIFPAPERTGAIRPAHPPHRAGAVRSSAVSGTRPACQRSFAPKRRFRVDWRPCQELRAGRHTGAVMPLIACYGKAMNYRLPISTRVRISLALLPAVLLLSAACALSGCSDGGPAYPSLASRPAERLTDTAEPASPSPDTAAQVNTAPAAPSAELAARL